MNQVATKLSNTCSRFHKNQHEHQTRARAQVMAFASSNCLRSEPTSTTIHSLLVNASMKPDSSLFPPTNSTFSPFPASFTWRTLPRHHLRRRCGHHFFSPISGRTSHSHTAGKDNSQRHASNRRRSLAQRKTAGNEVVAKGVAVL